MNKLVLDATQPAVKRELDFSVGDTVKVYYKIIEADKERVQLYEGIVISIANKGNAKTFTVRRVSYEIGVERIFPLYSPRISKIEITKKGKVRRAKLYYLRERKGKANKVKGLKNYKQQKSQVTEEVKAPVIEEVVGA